MPSSHLKELIREKVRQKLRERSQKQRKQVEGHVNITGVTTPKHKKPQKKQEDHGKKPAASSVAVGAHGGQYIQEPSGHKRYIHTGGLKQQNAIAAGRRLNKADIVDMVKEIASESEIKEFAKKFKRRKTNE